MAIRLKSIFLNPQFGLLFKAAVFAGFLAFAKISGFSVLSSGLLLLASIILYTRPFFRTVKFFWSFLVFLSSVFVFNLTFRDQLDFLFGLIYFSTAFLILLGVKELVLIRREVWGRLLNFLLIYPIFLIFFYYHQINIRIWQSIILFVVVQMISKNLISNRLFYWLIPFLIVQLSWAVSFLPIGFVGAANFTTLSYMILVLLVDEHLSGILDRKKVLSLITIFVLLMLAVLGVAYF